MAQLNDLLVLGESNLLGALNIYGDVTAPKFIGTLEGNATSATNATNANYATSAGSATNATNATKVYATKSIANSTQYFPMYASGNASGNKDAYIHPRFYIWDTGTRLHLCVGEQGTSTSDNTGAYSGGLTINSGSGKGKYVDIVPAAMTGHRTLTIPDASGTICLTSHNHDGTYLKLSGGTMTGSLTMHNGGSGIIWPAPANISTSATANGQEWSIDLLGSGTNTYTGTYFHVWSSKLGASILACYTDDRKVKAFANMEVGSNLSVGGSATTTGGITAGGTIKSTYSGPAFFGETAANAWSYLRLKSGDTFWDLAVQHNDTSGAFQLRPQGAGSKRFYVSKDGDATIEGTFLGIGANATKLTYNSTTESLDFIFT